MKPYQTVIDIIRELAHGHPDTHSGDKYFDWLEKTPHCIFGHAVARLGGQAVDPVDGARPGGILAPNGEWVAAGHESASYLDWPKLGVAPPSEEEAAWSDRVQQAQDSDSAWLEAVELADEEVGPVGIG